MQLTWRKCIRCTSQLTPPTRRMLRLSKGFQRLLVHIYAACTHRTASRQHHRRDTPRTCTLRGNYLRTGRKSLLLIHCCLCRKRSDEPLRASGATVDSQLVQPSRQCSMSRPVQSLTWRIAFGHLSPSPKGNDRVMCHPALANPVM